ARQRAPWLHVADGLFQIRYVLDAELGRVRRAYEATDRLRALQFAQWAIARVMYLGDTPSLLGVTPFQTDLGFLVPFTVTQRLAFFAMFGAQPIADYFRAVPESGLGNTTSDFLLVIPTQTLMYGAKSFGGLLWSLTLDYSINAVAGVALA